MMLTIGFVREGANGWQTECFEVRSFIISSAARQPSSMNWRARIRGENYI